MCLCFSLPFYWNSLCSLLPRHIMLFALVLCPSVEDSISPQKDVQRAVEGAAVVLSCSYNSSVVSSLLWYRQYPGSPPRFLIMEYSGYITNPIPGMNITHIKQQRLVELLISSAAVTDSALYYCALSLVILF
uniref:Ig-like domain-containing protein n=1 Tax=Gadus morhua TaxID=8049 RepID=A0A8C5AIW9_GADMO